MNARDSKNISQGAKPAMDWTAFDAQTDDEISAAIERDPNAAPILDEEWFERAELILPGRKRPI
jgi:hypothetical protein